MLFLKKYVKELWGSLPDLSMHILVISDIWKVARIIPILKPNKTAIIGESYRPISLLSPVVKILEALLFPAFKRHYSLSEHQHGFREDRSTTTALSEIKSIIANGLNKQRSCQRTVVADVDLSKAFGTVDHSILLRNLLNSTFHNALKRWISKYFGGRQAFVEFRGQQSPHRRIKMGYQGKHLSLILFNIYLTSLPELPSNTAFIPYADDYRLCFGREHRWNLYRYIQLHHVLGGTFP